MSRRVVIVKIGGSTLDDPGRRRAFLKSFSKIDGPKILVHGGGVGADQLCQRLGIIQQKVDGRRVTDRETLDVAVMVYAGLLNKTIVGELAAMGGVSLGVTGADANLITARKRPVQEIDYGFVGDVEKVNIGVLQGWLHQGIVPVVASITHDGAGQLLNTNADTIAAAIATSLAEHWEPSLIFAIDRPGVLFDGTDNTSVVESLNADSFTIMRAEGRVTAGMLPKLHNGFLALQNGVREVLVCGENALSDALIGVSRGTQLCL